MTKRSSLTLVLSLFAGAACFACGDDGDESSSSGSSNSGEGNTLEEGSTGAVCEMASECFGDVAEGELSGDAICLAEVDGGYCTHECAADEDCCAAEGECPNDFEQVCSPFQSTGQMMCFLSCEEADITRAQEGDEPPEDDAEFCQKNAGSDFICRSSGGGAANRKVCVPGDCGVGADCGSDDDCSGDLVCLTDYAGGYCTEVGCESDSDCPDDAACVDDGGDTNVCLKLCEASSDCSFCRGGSAAACDDSVGFVERSEGAVCRPSRN